jgi:adenine phosphoribosyltransferase
MSSSLTIPDFEKLLPIIPDFPKPGIQFRDIQPLLQNSEALRWTCDQFYRQLQTTPFEAILALEARGFVWGSILAEKFQVPLILGRKPGKLPQEVVSVEYKYEYAQGSLCMEKNSLKPGQKVLIVDDIIATGGTLRGATELVIKCGGQVSGIVALLDLKLPEREILHDHVLTLLYQDAHHNLQLNHHSIQTSKTLVSIPATNRPQYVVLAAPEMEELALSLQKLTMWSGQCSFEVVNWRYFADGYPNVTFPNNLLNKHVIFIMSLSSMKDFMVQLSLLMVLPRQEITSLEVILPYFAPGTMERVESPGIMATADTFANIISSCVPATQTGPPVLSVFDLHNSVVRFSFKDNIRFRPMSHIPLLIQHLTLYCGDRPWAVAFPDEGSYKRFRALIPSHIPLIICGKMRQQDERIVRILDVQGVSHVTDLAHIIIVDDLVQSGGTLHECHKALKQAHPQVLVSAAVTHAVFPQRSFLHFMPGGKWAGLANFWITDSIPQTAHLLKNQDPFRVISIVPTVGAQLALKYQLIKPVITVGLASTSALKHKAVTQAFREIFVGCSVVVRNHASESQISSQPVSHDQMVLGVTNRLLNLKGHVECDFAVAIENGIEIDVDEKGQRERVWDCAYIRVFHALSGTIVDVKSPKVLIDDQVYQAWKTQHDTDPNITIGQVYQARFGYAHDDWHVSVTGVSRQYLIYQALVRLTETIQLISNVQ